MLSGPAAASAGNASFSYTARNQLSEAPGEVYIYGVQGERIGIQNFDGSSISFVVDPRGSLDQVLMRSITGKANTYYVYGLGLIGEETNGSFSTYHFDYRGSTVALTDINGNITDTFSYGPYGEPPAHTGSSNTPFQFNGRYGVQTDTDSLLYMRSRYYNPVIRRFINQDVFFGDINPGISLNRFAFANENPVDAIDPLGEDAVAIGDGTFGYVIRAGIAIPSLIGSTITNSHRNYTGQCATAGQFLAGTEKKGRVYDVPRTGTWSQGPPVSSTTPIGTLIARGWHAERYPGDRGPTAGDGGFLNHTGIFEGLDPNKQGYIIVLDQYYGVPIGLRSYKVTEGSWSQVIGTVQHDSSPSDSAVKH